MNTDIRQRRHRRLYGARCRRADVRCRTKSEDGMREDGIRFHAEAIRCIVLGSREQQIECPGSITCEEVTTLRTIVLAFVLLLSLFAMTAWADEMTGYISDSKCGVKGASDSHADCAVKCVKGGAVP